jgi:DNA repair protein RecO (recombination protein O)
MAESTEGIVLRRVDYSETSLVLHFYTPEFGQVGTLAKGAKRPKSPFQGGVDLLTRNQIVFLRRGPGGLATLTESAILDDYRGLRTDLGRLFRAEYLAELVSAMTTEEDPNPALYGLLTHTLEALSAGRGDRVTHTIAFELGLLAATGYAVDWRHCVACGRALGEREKAHFSAAAGGVRCRECAGSESNGALDAGALAAAALLADACSAPVRALNGRLTAPLQAARRAERLRLAPSQIRPLGLILGRYFVHLVGRPLRMLKYLDADVRPSTTGRPQGL